MQPITTTSMSSNGQVVIPEVIRKQMKLKAESKFMVTTGNGSVILKAIDASSARDIDGITIGSDRLPRNNGLSEDAIERVISGVRGQY